jgi:hypothetical protein
VNAFALQIVDNCFEVVQANAPGETLCLVFRATLRQCRVERVLIAKPPFHVDHVLARAIEVKLNDGAHDIAFGPMRLDNATLMLQLVKFVPPTRLRSFTDRIVSSTARRAATAMFVAF